jgi:hypothetical protein
MYSTIEFFIYLLSPPPCIRGGGSMGDHDGPQLSYYEKSLELRRSGTLHVLVVDSVNNNRNLGKDPDTLHYDTSFLKEALNERGITQEFRNYYVINPDGSLYSIEGTCLVTCDKPDGEPSEITDKIYNRVYRHFDNPRRFVERVGLFVKHIRVGYFEFDIYPHNTAMQLEWKFRQPALRALDELGIRTELHYDQRQLNIFEDAGLDSIVR